MRKLVASIQSGVGQKTKNIGIADKEFCGFAARLKLKITLGLSNVLYVLLIQFIVTSFIALFQIS
jgi:hypothetical protein